ncbi:MAG TPA: hypothetical protein PKB02_11820 [Anaerohalosphaeraceae bacterium]|nr:hypothetical protein [Anaerohalosphaeraceae bacterium]
MADKGIFLSLAASGKSRFIIQIKRLFTFLASEQKSSLCRSKAIFRATLYPSAGGWMHIRSTGIFRGGAVANFAMVFFCRRG